MTPALVFPYKRQASSDGRADAVLAAGGRGARDGILYANAEAALALAGAVEAAGTASLPPPAAMPGLLCIGSDEQVLAVGLDAHLALADCQKCTLLAEPLDFHRAADGEGRAEEGAINSLLWSCINTRRAVILGRRAWSEAQLLPFADLRFHATPPLRWIRSDDMLDEAKVLVIDHEKAGTLAEELRATLSGHARVEVMKGWLLDGERPAELSDLDAGTHLHVGEHTLLSDSLRLVDSWINRIPVLHLRSRRSPPSRSAGDACLKVREAQNGFDCASIGEALAAFQDLRGDRTLRGKMARAGERTAAPLADGWRAIAVELLDG